jgi:hypothetical protein
MTANKLLGVVGGGVVGGGVVGGGVVGGGAVGDGVGVGLSVNVGVGEEGDAAGDVVGVLVVGLCTGVGLLVALPPVPLLLLWLGAESAADGVGLLVVEPVLCGFAPVRPDDGLGSVLPALCVVAGDAAE